MAVAVATPSSMEARPSPAGSPGQQPASHAPYPYPVHQQSSSSSSTGSPAGSPPPQGWAPAGPPAFYPWQGGYPQMAPQGFYDPNAAQFAQWYHHMMLQQQQQQQGGQRPPGPGQAPPHFPAFNHHAHNPFPSGTPPPAPQPAYARPPQQQQQQQQPAGPGQQNYDGFHPYRRPQRQNTAEQHAQFSGLAPAHPPYARGADAAGSSSSVNSTNSNSTGRPRERERTSSLQKSHQQQSQRPSPPPNIQQQQQQRSRSQPAPSSLSRATAASPASSGPLAPPVRPQPHTRTGSNSSTASAAARPQPSPTSTQPAPAPQAKPKAASTISAGSIGTIGVSPAPAGTPVARTPRPSPLGTAPPMSNADKRKSRDDSELLASGPPTNFGDGAHRPGGLKGKLRRALSLSAAQSIEPVVGGEDEEGPEGSAAGKKKRRALFNAKLNASTDNISLSSTMSSASVVIRKLGSLGKMARRNSIAGITSVFKGRKGKDDDEDGVIVDEPPPDDLAAAAATAATDKDKKKKEKDKKKGKASAKGAVAPPSVSNATVEVDRPSAEFTGLSPAAELARRHTLKANAQEAARIEAERRAAEAAAANAGKDLPETWAKNTATRAGVAGAGVYRVNEAGERVLVEDAEVDDDPSAHDYSQYLDEEEGEWSRMDDAYEGEDGDGDETVRMRLRPGDEEGSGEEEDVEEWAVGLRRSVERTLVPQRGILKNARNYDQHLFLERGDQSSAPAARARANSAEQAGAKHPPGALARIPSPDPDHIDGLHRQHAPTLPPLSFTDSPGASDAEDTPASQTHSKLAQSVFSRPALNSSAPVLSLDAPSPPTLTHRAATAPAKRLTFASNLSVYDTFPGQVYDRRSEPATWSRLTPALAQRIKEELNSFKMEEMEVHAASRIHTQFFV